MRWSFSPSKGTIFFLKFSSNIETSCQQNKTSSDKLEIPCGTNFLRVLIFTMFTIFPSAIRKNKFPQKIIKRKHFSRKNLIQIIKYTLYKIYKKKKKKKKEIVSVQLQLAPQFRNKTVYNELVLHSVRIPRSTVWKSVFPLQPDCTYLTRTKILSMPGTGYFLKVNSQQKNQRVLVSWMLYGRSSGYHGFNQKQGLFYSFNPHRTMARSHTTRNRDFLESISF